MGSSHLGAGHEREEFPTGEEPRAHSVALRCEVFIKGIRSFRSLCDGGPYPAPMLPSLGYQGFRTAPIPAGWVQMGERWALWWNGREIASLSPDRAGGLRMTLNALKMWQTKNVRVVSLRQGKRFAERWCAARLYPGLPLREAVVRLTDSTPIAPAAPLPPLPPTREQQQAQRLDEAAATAAARVRSALDPIRPPAAVKPRPKDPMKVRIRRDRPTV